MQQNKKTAVKKPKEGSSVRACRDAMMIALNFAILLQIRKRVGTPNKYDDAIRRMMRDVIYTGPGHKHLEIGTIAYALGVCDDRNCRQQCSHASRQPFHGYICVPGATTPDAMVTSLTNSNLDKLSWEKDEATGLVKMIKGPFLTLKCLVHLIECSFCANRTTFNFKVQGKDNNRFIMILEDKIDYRKVIDLIYTLRTYYPETQYDKYVSEMFPNLNTTTLPSIKMIKAVESDDGANVQSDSETNVSEHDILSPTELFQAKTVSLSDVLPKENRNQSLQKTLPQETSTVVPSTRKAIALPPHMSNLVSSGKPLPITPQIVDKIQKMPSQAQLNLTYQLKANSDAPNQVNHGDVLSTKTDNQITPLLNNVSQRPTPNVILADKPNVVKRPAPVVSCTELSFWNFTPVTKPSVQQTFSLPYQLPDSQQKASSVVENHVINRNLSLPPVNKPSNSMNGFQLPSNSLAMFNDGKPLQNNLPPKTSFVRKEIALPSHMSNLVSSGKPFPSFSSVVEANHANNEKLSPLQTAKPTVPVDADKSPAALPQRSTLDIPLPDDKNPIHEQTSTPVDMHYTESLFEAPPPKVDAVQIQQKTSTGEQKSTNDGILQSHTTNMIVKSGSSFAQKEKNQVQEPPLKKRKIQELESTIELTDQPINTPILFQQWSADKNTLIVYLLRNTVCTYRGKCVQIGGKFYAEIEETQDWPQDVNERAMIETGRDDCEEQTKQTIRIELPFNSSSFISSDNELVLAAVFTRISGWGPIA